MRKRPGYPIAIRTSRFAATVLLATVCAGCSSNLARFDGDPFSNPFVNRRDNLTTGSVRQQTPHKVSATAPPPYRTAAVSAARVSSAPLPAPGSGSLGQLKVQPAKSVSVATSPTAVRLAARPISTGTIAAKAAPGWSTKGGTPITLKQGETIETVANRYGVPAPVLLNVNGLSSSSQAVPGKLLIIPTYSATLLRSGGNARSDLAGKAASLLPSLKSGQPFLNAGPTLHFAFSGDMDAPKVEVLDESAVLAFADETEAKAPAPKKVRSTTNIAAPISIKPPLSVTQKLSTPAPAKDVVAAKPAPAKVVAAKPTPSKIATSKIAAAPRPAGKPVLKQAAAKPVGQPRKILAAAPQKQSGSKTIAALAKPVKAAPPVKTTRIEPKVKLAGVPNSSKSAAPALSATKMQTAAKKPAGSVVAAAKKVPAVAIKASAKPAAIAATSVRPAKPDVQPSEISAYAADTTATGSLPPGGAAIPASDNGVFRWPARGRVISSFGSKDVSGTNNGINISMPEGTPVKAAEAGMVAYSGDDVKKYGKLVLIKHENGYVSAYAHNGELDVRKGEAVKRGQIIAKSGASGDVTSPQLHFQLRKGEQPVDPIKLLDAN